MENANSQFDINITVAEELLSLSASGSYSLIKAKNLFKLPIDSAVSHNKSKILVDVTNITGHVPFFDRFQYSEFLSIYRSEHAPGKISKIAVVGQEPIVDERRFGETVAVNRGTNSRVFTDMSEASTWLEKK